MIKTQYSIKEKEDLIILTVECEATKDPSKRYKLGNSYARRVLTEEGYDATLLKGSTLISSHESETKAIWKFKNNKPSRTKTPHEEKPKPTPSLKEKPKPKTKIKRKQKLKKSSKEE